VVRNLSPQNIAATDPGDIAQLPGADTTFTRAFPTEAQHDTTTADPAAPAGAADASPAAQAHAPNSDLPLKDYLREQEVAYLNRIMAQMGGDKEKAAIHLGISLATLYRKLSEDDQVS
jgi:DNA-binding NtrC family response regulator